MREAQLEAKCRKYTESKGGKLYKWVSPMNAGVPDRILILPHKRPVFVEFKTETGRLSMLQEAVADELRSLGQKVYVVRSFETFKKLVDGGNI